MVASRKTNPRHKKNSSLGSRKNPNLDFIFTNNRLGVYNYHYRRCRNHFTAEDLCSQTFLKFQKSGYAGKAYAIPRLFRVAHSVSVDYQRKNGNSPPLTPIDDIEFPDPTMPDKDFPLDEYISDEDLQDALRILTDSERTLLAMRFVTDLTYKEIADSLGKSEIWAKKKFHEILQKLHDYLSGRQ